MAAAVCGIATTRDQLALLELVQKSDDVAWIQAQRVGEGLLARRSLFAEQLQSNEVTRAEAARLEGDLESATTNAGEVLEQWKESLVRDRRGLACRHPNNDTRYTNGLWYTRHMTVRDLGLLAIRIAVGGTLVAHGAQKLFGWFGGAGLERTGATFERFGFRPGKLNAIAAGLGEAGGGALLAVGLGTPGAGAAVVGTMIVASSMHVDNGFFNSKGGFEYPAVLGWSAAALALTGPGALSVDHALGHRLNRSWMRNLALAAAAPAAFAVIARRRRTVAATPATQLDPTPQVVSS